jgi:putative (di)nucleoside polyphosphate hydrolase
MNSLNLNTIDNRYYRQCVGAVLFNKQGQVWLGKRIEEKNKFRRYAWQMPQGGIDPGEDPSVAVMRELMEETGTDRAQIYRSSVHWFNYDLPKKLMRNDHNGGFKGQTQKWFALRFNGSDSDFNLNTHEKPEFSEWRWASLNDIADLIVPFKRDVYVNVVDEFKDIPERIVNE